MTRRELIWASDGATGRDLVEATAGELGLTVRCCTVRELGDRARAAQADLIGIETGADVAAGLSLVAELHGRLPHANIIVASPDGSVGFIRAALDAGAHDVLSLPLQPGELHKAMVRASQAKPRAAAAPESLGEVITVYGVRGGLGATTIAVNLASRLTALTASGTALVDLDLQRGDVATFLNLTPAHSIASFASAPGEIDDVFLSSTLTRHPNGVFVLPAPPEIEDAELIGHGEVKAALDLLRAQFRYTVVDTARTVTGATAAALEASRRVLLVSDLSVPGVRAARRGVELLARLGVSLEHVELLVSEAFPGPVTVQDASRAIGKEPFFVVPRDQSSAADAMNHGIPLNGKPTPLALAMTELAAKVAGVSVENKPGSSRLLKRLFTRTERVHA
jgi:pilus assembly protein CpaE